MSAQPEVRPPLAEHFFIAGLETSAIVAASNVPVSVSSLASALSSTSLSAGLGGNPSARGSVRLSSGSMRMSMTAAGSPNTATDVLPSPGGGMLLDVKIDEEHEPEERDRERERGRERPELGRSKPVSQSARSSATITASALSVNTATRLSLLAGPGLQTPTSITELSSFAAAQNAIANPNEVDFEETLRRFAEERDSFLESQFTASNTNSWIGPSGSNGGGLNGSLGLSTSVRRLSSWRRRTVDDASGLVSGGGGGGGGIGGGIGSGISSNGNSTIQLPTGTPALSSTSANPIPASSHSSLTPSSRPGVGTAGSLRRKLSTMSSTLKRTSSLARQPSVGRQSSVRTARRVSGYNSVITVPTPFRPDPAMHPLARRYEPVLLDRYPRQKEEALADGRCPFPDYVPMFAFPNDITVLSSDCRPRPVWHAFAMTGADGSTIHGVCMTVWIGVDVRVAAELEAQCERWRVANMSSAEREFANSLGERLVTEKAKLANLMARLAVMPRSSPEREELEVAVNSAEEKVGLITLLLRPVRHGAAAKIEGLTDGESGLWIPRAYGILGREGEMLPVWKEWLRAVAVPMQAVTGALTGVPPSCHRTGVWRPLEQYVRSFVSIPSPGPTEQVEIRIRELRMFARHSAPKELPGHRSTDLYPLFRALSVANVVLLFEAVLSEMRIVLLSSHPAMLHSASAAIRSLLFPLEWAAISIPLIPARLMQALDAPCPYIIGVDRRYDNVSLPEDDFVLVDLDMDTVEFVAAPSPTPLPKTQRRKLISLLQLAASHNTRFGVARGVPSYVTEAFPGGRFASEFGDIFSEKILPQTVATLAGLSSSVYTCNSSTIPGLGPISGPVVDLFAKARIESEATNLQGLSECDERGSLGSPGSVATSPTLRSDSSFNLRPVLREKRSEQFDSGRRSLSFGGTLRRLQSGGSSVHGSIKSRAFGLGHFSTASTSTLVPGQHPTVSHSYAPSISAPSVYAPSVYAPSSYAPSTILPTFETEAERSGSGMEVIEGHVLERRSSQPPVSVVGPPSSTLGTLGRVPSLGRRERERSYRGATPHGSISSRHPRMPSTASMMTPHPVATVVGSCQLCGFADDELLFCKSCPLAVHDRCVSSISTICSAAFKQVLVRAAFLRCFASLLYTYRRALRPLSASEASKPSRRIPDEHARTLHFDIETFVASVPSEQRPFIEMLSHTQAFSNFIDQCERPRPRSSSGLGDGDSARRGHSSEPSNGPDKIALFDEAVMAKRNRGRGISLNLGFGLGKRGMSKTAEAAGWENVGPRNDSKNDVSGRSSGHLNEAGRASSEDWDYLEIISRTPAKLESRF